MELNAETLYNVALEQCMVLQKQVIELKSLYIELSKELEELKNNDK